MWPQGAIDAVVTHRAFRALSRLAIGVMAICSPPIAIRQIVRSRWIAVWCGAGREVFVRQWAGRAMTIGQLAVRRVNDSIAANAQQADRLMPCY